MFRLEQVIERKKKRIKIGVFFWGGKEKKKEKQEKKKKKDKPKFPAIPDVPTGNFVMAVLCEC